MEKAQNYFNYKKENFKNEISQFYPWLFPSEKLFLESGKYVSNLLYEKLYLERKNKKLTRVTLPY